MFPGLSTWVRPGQPVDSNNAPLVPPGMENPIRPQLLPPGMENLSQAQLAILLSHLQGSAALTQNGSLPPPPPPPPTVIPLPLQRLIQTSHVGQNGSHTPLVRTTSASGGSSDMNMSDGREEGEMSETPPMPNTPPAPMSRKRKIHTSSDSQISRRKLEHHVDQLSIQTKKELVSNFVQVLQEEGFGYSAISSEVSDQDVLREIYTELGSAIDGVSFGHSQNTTSLAAPKQHPAPTAFPAAKAMPEKRKTPPADTTLPPKSDVVPARNDYLARLKAAKTGIAVTKAKQAITSMASQNVAMPINGTGGEKTSNANTSQAEVSRSVKAQDDEKTKLIHKKMEALKALQKQRQQANKGTVEDDEAVGMPATTDTRASVSMSTSDDRDAKLKLLKEKLKAQSSVANKLAAEAAVVSSQTPAASPGSNRGKRPVASDLIQSGLSNVHSQSPRPFGKSTRTSDDEAMIIEVSDDESEEEEMQLLREDRGRRRIDIAPLRDFPPRGNIGRSFGVKPPSPSNMTPNALQELEELKRKEKEITDLNTRIAEHEKRKAAAAQAKQTVRVFPSGSTNDADGQYKPLVSNADDLQVEQGGLTNNSKRRRLQTELGERDRLAMEKKSRFEAMQRQIAQMQEELEEDERAQAGLRKELESLEVDTDGMTRSDMEAIRDELVDQAEAQAVISDNVGDAIKTSDQEHNVSQGVVDTIGVEPSETVKEPKSANNTEDHHSPIGETSAESVDLTTEETVDRVVQDDVTPASAGVGALASERVSDGFSMAKSDSEVESAAITSPHAVAAGIPTEVQEATVHSSRERSQSASQHVDTDVKESTGTKVDKINSASEEGETTDAGPSSRPEAGLEGSDDDMSMDTSTSTSPEPEEIAKAHGMHVSGSTSQQPQSPGEMSTAVPAEDLTQATAAALTKQNESDSGSDMDLDTSESSLSAEEDQDVSKPATEESPNGYASSDLLTSSMYDSSDVDMPEPAQPGKSSREPTDVAKESTPVHRQAQGRIITEGLAVADPQVEKPSQTEVEEMPKKDEYVPYKRRLPEFKLYRMHPNYLDDVSQGFRSMTYSHKIDANQPMCKRETQGYKCSDTICDDQHLKDIQLTDDEILVQLGSAIPCVTKESHDEYVHGLRQLIGVMKQRELDTDEIFAEVVKYRRDFVGDPTMVLCYDIGDLPEHMKMKPERL